MADDKDVEMAVKSDVQDIGVHEAVRDDQIKTGEKQSSKNAGALEVSFQHTRTLFFLLSYFPFFSVQFGTNLTDLQKYINFVSAINFGFILQCSWEAAAVTFQFSLANGGPAAMFYGSLFAGIGTTAVAISLAEVASIDPTVGAQYRWSAKFAPRWNEFWGLMQGNSLGLATKCQLTLARLGDRLRMDM